MYSIVPSKDFTKALRKLKQSGKFKEAKLQEALRLLKIGNPLPAQYNDHQLHGDLGTVRECHVAGDIVLLYKRNDELCIITLADVGTNHQIFGK